MSEPQLVFIECFLLLKLGGGALNAASCHRSGSMALSPPLRSTSAMCHNALLMLQIFIDAFDGSALGHPVPVGTAARIIAFAPLW
jgi:hypothetical protein